MDSGDFSLYTCRVDGAAVVDCLQRWLPVSLPLPVYTSQSSHQEVGSVSPPLESGLDWRHALTNRIWHSDVVPVLGPALNRLATSAFILLEASHHVVRKL